MKIYTLKNRKKLQNFQLCAKKFIPFVLGFEDAGVSLLIMVIGDFVGDFVGDADFIAGVEVGSAFVDFVGVVELFHVVFWNDTAGGVPFEESGEFKKRQY